MFEIFKSKNKESRAYRKIKVFVDFTKIEKFLKKVRVEELAEIALSFHSNSVQYEHAVRKTAISLLNDEKILEKIATSTVSYNIADNDMLRKQACEKLGHDLVQNCYCRRCRSTIHELSGCKCKRCGKAATHKYVPIPVSSLPKEMQNAAFAESHAMQGIATKIFASKCMRCNDFIWVVINNDM